MKSLIFSILVIIFLLISCSTNKYITNLEPEHNFEGTWQVNNQKQTRLVISPIEENVYNLNFSSAEYSWEGIGYLVDNELLAIFNYHYIGKKGYITFQFIAKNKISFKSINTDGSPRSKGFLIKLNEF